ncbi:ABC transporter ATP-binding protein [Campylobacter sp. MIT 19-121]|uniref:ABC transporter ATP-binding protein n=1 Tax=Campylobacter sp. MIT 19-121 TaxID=2703906 RepID=UPI00138A08DE|nr:ATP-binding cassette domain-containing protein [Campylobacter sp. MIT 19-121]NDJ27088.1 ABC transporter ATP-binding protein [Campylobacter sp. MIT 19-121]
MNLLECKNLSVCDEKQNYLLKNINFKLKKDEYLAIIGSSGAGKSTLIKALMNLNSSNLTSKGELFWHEKANFGVILQNPASCFDHVFSIKFHFKETFLAKNLKPDEQEYKRLLAEVGLDEKVLNAYPFELSGGMLQRVMIALALCAPLNLLIADEASSDLDSSGEKELFELIFRLKAKFHFAFLLVTHSLKLAQNADTIIILDQGQIIDQGNAKYIFTQSKCKKTKAFLEAFHLLEQNSFKPKPKPKTKALLLAKNINLSYKQGGFFSRQKPKIVLNKLDLKLYEGVNLAIVGKNGSGKSSLVRVLLGLEKAKNASLNLNGFDFCTQKLEYKKSLGIIFQNPPATLNPNFSAKEAILEPLWNLNIDKQSQEQELKKLAKALNLSELDKKVPYFSGGELQRIALARALITKPSLLILDEALSNLDVLLQVQIIKLLKALQAEFKLTLLCISHDQNILNALCDELLELKDGVLNEL